MADNIMTLFAQFDAKTYRFYVSRNLYINVLKMILLYLIKKLFI